MLEQRIQQHFIDSADLKYQAAQVLSHPIAAWYFRSALSMKCWQRWP